MRLSFALVGLACAAATSSGCVNVLPASQSASVAAPGKPGEGHLGALGPASVASLKQDSDRHIYRLDFVLSSGDATPTTGAAFTMNLRENDVGDIRNDTNLPLTPAAPGSNGTSSARMDVGTNLKANYSMVGDDLFLQTSTELSGTDEPGTIRKLSAHGDALVAPGKPTLVASIADASGHKRYELTVTATKLR